MAIDLNRGIPHGPSKVLETSSESSDLSAMTELRGKLVLDTRNYFISKIIPGLMGLLTVAVFVRMVGYEQYGRYAVLMAATTACATGGAGWLSQGILRFASQYAGTGGADSFRRGSNLGILLAALLGGLALSVIVAFQHSGLVLAVALILYLPMLTYTVEVTRVQASLRSETVVRIEGIRAISSFAIPLILVLVTGRKDYLLLLGGVGVGYLIPLAARFGNSQSSRAKASERFAWLGNSERNALNRVWTYGWPVALWLVCQQCLVVSDRYFIQRFWGYSAAGVYASIYDVIVRSFALVFAPITMSVHSVLMHRWNQGDRQSSIAALKKAMGYEVLLFIPVLVALLFLKPWIARLILGKANLEAAGSILPLAVAGFLWQLALLAHKPLEILCRTKRMLIGILLTLACNVLGNYFLVPRFGFIAAAYLSAGASCLYLMLLVVLTPGEELHAATHERLRSVALPEKVGA